MELDYKLPLKSNSVRFVIVYPEGVRSDGKLGIRTWNAGTCCDFAMQQNIVNQTIINNIRETVKKTEIEKQEAIFIFRNLKKTNKRSVYKNHYKREILQ